ncbi:MAG: zinc-dependent metalloprotease [Longimicrobiales bacterium]|nr:zinc-dependent metalloprotease [Longimicrobiales bacterium]
MIIHRPTRTLPLLLLAAATACSTGGGAAPSPAAPAGGGGSARPAPRGGTDGPRPYAQVVTERAVTDVGVLTVHRVGNDWLFEVPHDLLGRDFLLITRIAGVPADFGGFLSAGMSVNEQLVRFQRVGDRIVVRKVSFREMADPEEPIYRSVVSNNLPPVLGAFPIAAFSPDSTASVLDVTAFFQGDTPALGGLNQNQRRNYGVRRLDPDRSFITRMRAFPENVEVRHTQTFDATSPPGDASTGTITLGMSQSLVLLPEEPMRPRYADPRVGYFSVQRINYGLDEQKAATQTFIRRWRLEPSDPVAYARGELVEPVEPITYYLDPATPPRWREYVRQGVEDWNVAFEAAGFRNAIRALDPPSVEEDPEWDPEDVRYSVVRWTASTTRNAMGPSVSDPRTGEIIESDIVWYHNHMRSYRNRLMLETGAANPQARTLNQPDELMGEAMRQVIAHEIGHAIGLPHNMIASSAYPVDSLRNADFARRMGVSPSVMDYARQNYVAQPGDGLAPHDFIRQIGPYDLYSVEWGYRVFDAPDPESERAQLNRMILDKAHDPMYRYLPQGGMGGIDPRAQTEDMGDDPVRASGYGVESLKGATRNLVQWTSTPGQGYDDLEELYGELLGQWSRYMGHVVTLVGGAYVDLKSSEQAGPVFDGVPRARQEEALDFLRAQVFQTPAWLHPREILDRIGPQGRVQTLGARQAAILNQLLDPRRLTRMGEMEILQPEDAWPLAEYLPALRRAVFGDLSSVAAVDGYRRALHRAWVERAGSLLTEDPPAPPGPFGGGPAVALDRSDVRPLLRQELRRLLGETEAAAARVRHPMTRTHFEDLAVRVRRLLNPSGEAQ